jgi:hypothetical protein
MFEKNIVAWCIVAFSARGKSVISHTS